VRELSGGYAVHVTDDREAEASKRGRGSGYPLLIIESPYRAFVAPMLAYVGLQRPSPERRSRWFARVRRVIVERPCTTRMSSGRSLT
jgi:hypothetical protein